MLFGVFTFRHLTESDFDLLRYWLRQPHVARWWTHETSVEAVARDFGPTARGEEPAEDLLAFLDGRPFGLVQRSRLADYPEYHKEFAATVAVPDGAVTIDYLIGEPADTGRGLGTAMIRAVLDQTWAAHPDATAVLVAVSAANGASWRALEKAGLTRIGEGDMEPDNPVDDRRHYLYRVDRGGN